MDSYIFITAMCLFSLSLSYACALRSNQQLQYHLSKALENSTGKEYSLLERRAFRFSVMLREGYTVSCCRLHDFFEPWLPTITNEWTWHRLISTSFIAFTGFSKKMLKGRQVSSTNEMMASVEHDPLHSNVPATKIEVTVSCRLVTTSLQLKMNKRHEFIR